MTSAAPAALPAPHAFVASRQIDRGFCGARRDDGLAVTPRGTPICGLHETDPLHEGESDGEASTAALARQQGAVQAAEGLAQAHEAAAQPALI